MKYNQKEEKTEAGITGENIEPPTKWRRKQQKANAFLSFSVQSQQQKFLSGAHWTAVISAVCLFSEKNFYMNFQLLSDWTKTAFRQADLHWRTKCDFRCERQFLRSSVCFRSPSCHYKYLWTLKQARQRLATIEVVPKQEASHSCNSDAIYQCSAAGPQSTPDFAVQWAVSGCPVHPSIMICLLPFGICRGKHVSGYTTYIAVSCTFV